MAEARKSGPEPFHALTMFPRSPAKRSGAVGAK
jgi:hypothetical protein